jgi:hypothetical protein
MERPLRGAILDPACPVEWAHPLNRGLLADYTAGPNSGWRGGATLRDLAGLSGRKSHAGTLTGGTAWASGPSGFGSLSFDGTDDYVACGPAPTLTGEAALSCWYKRGGSDAANTQVLVCNGGDNYRLTVSASSNAFALSGEYTGFPSLSASVDLTGGWHFLAAQATAGNFELYHNGVLAAGPSAKAAAASASGNLELGRFSGSTLWTRGSIAGVLVHGRSLTAGEWAAFYAESRRGNPERYRWLRPWSFGVTVAGGTQTISPAGSCTAAGTLARAVTKGLAGSSAGAGALARSCAKPLSGSATAAAALAKLVAKPLSGSATAAGALAKAAAKPLAGSAAPAGALSAVKVAVLGLAGAVAAAGALVRAAAKALAGRVTGAGSLSTSGGATPGAGGFVRATAGGRAKVAGTAGGSAKATGRPGGPN